MREEEKISKSSVTESENSYTYRIEWEDYITEDYDWSRNSMKTIHYGSGSRNIDSLNNARDVYNEYKDDSDYKGVRLIRIDSNGLESVYESN